MQLAALPAADLAITGLLRWYVGIIEQPLSFADLESPHAFFQFLESLYGPDPVASLQDLVALPVTDEALAGLLRRYISNIETPWDSPGSESMHASFAFVESL